MKMQPAYPAAPPPPSLWASIAPPAPATPTLDRDLTTEVVIIGAGLTGLSAAWELSKRGVQCAVLEANDAGWGASGRNGGMAVLRYKRFWSVLARELGNDSTLELYKSLHDGLDTLESNIAELGIDCGFERCGHLTAAHGQRAFSRLEDDCRWLAAVAGDTTPRMLARAEFEALTGSVSYTGGYLDSRSAGIHPLHLSRGFASALVARGIPIYGNSPALKLAIGRDQTTVTTPQAEVRARQALVCTNAYTDAFSFGVDLNKRIVPISAAVITTAPLSPGDLQRVLPQRHLVTDTRNLVNYFRCVPGGRLLFGGRGSLVGKEGARYYQHLVHCMHRTYPFLRDIPIDYRWSGKVAITLDDMPHIGAIGDRVYYAMGYGGRGVVLTSLLGKHLARYALGEKPRLGPMSDGRFPRIPFSGLRIPIMNTVAAYYKARDYLAL